MEGVKLHKAVLTLRELKASTKVQPAKRPIKSRTVYITLSWAPLPPEALLGSETSGWETPSPETLTRSC